MTKVTTHGFFGLLLQLYQSRWATYTFDLYICALFSHSWIINIFVAQNHLPGHFLFLSFRSGKRILSLLQTKVVPREQRLIVKSDIRLLAIYIVQCSVTRIVDISFGVIVTRWNRMKDKSFFELSKISVSIFMIYK